VARLGSEIGLQQQADEIDPGLAAAGTAPVDECHGVVFRDDAVVVAKIEVEEGLAEGKTGQEALRSRALVSTVQRHRELDPTCEVVSLGSPSDHYNSETVLVGLNTEHGTTLELLSEEISFCLVGLDGSATLFGIGRQ
jgi:hypothetical protein